MSDKWKGTRWTLCNCKEPTPGCDCGGVVYTTDESGDNNGKKKDK